MEEKVLPSTFCGNRFLINSAIMNILDNAVKYSCEGSSVNLQVIGRDDGVLSFTVCDYGPGFSAEALKNAAKEFYTGQTARSGGHYGLGLYIAQVIAEKHDGRLEFGNRENGQGAMVVLTLKSVTES